MLRSVACIPYAVREKLVQRGMCMQMEDVEKVVWQNAVLNDSSISISNNFGCNYKKFFAAQGFVTILF